MSEHDYSPGTQHEYISIKAPRFSTRIEDENGKDIYIQFEEGRLTLDGPVAKIFDEARTKYSGTAQYVQRVNRDVALQMVAEHRASQVHAIKGGIDSRASQGMVPGLLFGSQKRLEEVAPNNPEALQQFVNELTGKDNIAITETVVQPEPPKEPPKFFQSPPPHLLPQN